MRPDEWTKQFIKKVTVSEHGLIIFQHEHSSSQIGTIKHVPSGRCTANTNGGGGANIQLPLVLSWAINEGKQIRETKKKETRTQRQKRHVVPTCWRALPAYYRQHKR